MPRKSRGGRSYKPTGARPQQKRNAVTGDRDIWDDPETNGKAFYEQADYREFLARFSRAVTKEPRGHGTLKQKLGKVYGVPWPHEQWFAYSLDLIQDSRAVEYLNAKYKMKLKVIYCRPGFRDMYTTEAPPVKHYKQIRKVHPGMAPQFV